MPLGRDQMQARKEADISSEMTQAAFEVINELKFSSGDGGRQQWKVIREYLLDDRNDPKYLNDQLLRSSDAARLDRAWTAVAEDEDRTEATIRQAGLQYHDATNDMTATRNFLENLREIEAKYRG